MMKLFGRTKKLRIIEVPTTKLSLAQWRADPALVSSMSSLLNQQTMRWALAVLRNEHPSHWMLADGSAINERAIAQARAEGYELCLNTLESLGKLKESIKHIESVFLPDGGRQNPPAWRETRPPEL